MSLTEQSGDTILSYREGSAVKSSDSELHTGTEEIRFFEPAPGCGLPHTSSKNIEKLTHHIQLTHCWK